MPLFRPRLPTISIEPCLPGLAKTPPTGPDWIHEIKHDGFRVMARRDGRKVRLTSRKGKDLTYRFPLVAQAIAALPVHSCLIDGEAIVSDASGFGRIQIDPQLSERTARHALCVRSYRNRRRRLALAADRRPQGCA